MRADVGAFKLGLIVAIFFGVGVATADAANEIIDVTIDFAKLVKVDRKPHTIVIGNPGIADTALGDDQTLVLTGKAAGTTNLIALDEEGNEILSATVRVSSDIRQLTTVFYGAQRQTFSCAPVCEHVISVGDNKEMFENATNQIQTRKQFSTGQ